MVSTITSSMPSISSKNPEWGADPELQHNSQEENRSTIVKAELVGSQERKEFHACFFE